MTNLLPLKPGNRVKVVRENDVQYEGGPPVGLVGKVSGYYEGYHIHCADNPIINIRWEGGYTEHRAARRKQLRKIPDRKGEVMEAVRPDWLWNEDAGIDRTYSATNMMDAAEALDEVRAYIMEIEDHINAPRCDCGHLKSDHDFSDPDFNTPCFPRTRCGCNNYVPLRPEKDVRP